MKVKEPQDSFFVALFLAFIYAKMRRAETMSDPELQLEKQRAELLKQINSVGDLRRGSITATSGKCGKPTCRCAKPGAVGHGPSYRLTRKVQGKTVTETFPSPAALRKAQREVEEFHRFQDLCDKVVVVSEQLCAARPAEDTTALEEKKRLKRSIWRSRAK
jgi:hypothetical protein